MSLLYFNNVIWIAPAIHSQNYNKMNYIPNIQKKKQQMNKKATNIIISSSSRYFTGTWGKGRTCSRPTCCQKR